MKPAIYRFNEKWIPVTESGCWLWIAGVNGSGYGSLKINGNHMLAHRFSYESFYGAINHDLHVLHSCDVRCCVNPEHLFLGTNADNIKDRVKKNRSVVGEDHYAAKLSNKDVIEIKNILRLPSNERPAQKAIAKMYGVSVSTINDINTKKHWKHI